MKIFIALFLVLAASLVFGADTPSSNLQPGSIKGEVLEVKEVENYTYLRLKTKEGESWAAIAKASVKKGAEVTIDNVTTVNDFESKSLNRKFQTIYFGNLAVPGGSPTATSNAMPLGHPPMSQAADTSDIHVTKASGANARTVMEVVTKAAELKDKTVLVRGKVVKYNSGIMGKNWVHLRDGTGSAAEGTHDLLVTSTNEAKLGDIVTAKGLVRTDKDFGSGYAYKVLLEEATFR